LLSVAVNASTEPVDMRKAGFLGHSLINQNITMMVRQIAESLGKQHDQAIQLMHGAPCIRTSTVAMKLISQVSGHLAILYAMS
jgi:hypothetical protein